LEFGRPDSPRAWRAQEARFRVSEIRKRRGRAPILEK
jgi:hypothetical protein